MTCELNRRRFAMVAAWLYSHVGTICVGEDSESPALPPGLFLQERFNAVSLGNAANHYIKLGEAKTLREFESLIRDNDAIPKYNSEERVFWLCRILFSFQESTPIRPPHLGTLPLPHDQFCPADWPVYPLAKSGNSYFVLCEGYSLTGMPEPIDKYFKACKTYGNFRTQTIAVPTLFECQQDLMRLRQSRRWKMINWKNESSWYTATESDVLDYMAKQTMEM